MAFKGFDRMKKTMDKIQDLQEKNPNETVEVDNKKKPAKVIKAGDMSPETKALPDETRPTPKGIGSSEKDMGPMKDPKKGAEEGLKVGGVKAMGMKKGGSVSSASKRADGIATKGKTRGKIC
jgi:hypothetical protein